MARDGRQRTDPTPAARPDRRTAWLATGVVVFVLAAVNVADHRVPRLSLWLGLPGAIVLLGSALALGLTWDELGLGRSRLRAGLLVGLAAISVVAIVYTVGVLLPATRAGFLDKRYDVGAAGALRLAFVTIPLGTVVFEEVAFRGVLWGLLARNLTPRVVLIVTSLLFGLWHILPSLHLAAANTGVAHTVGGSSGAASVVAVLGTVAFTALGGLVFGFLRLRSGSLLASMGAHWATNGLGVLFGLAARHLG